MNETLHQSPLPARTLHGRQFKLGPVPIAIMLVLLIGGLGLLVWTATPHSLLEGRQHAGTAAATDQLSRNQVASKSLQEILAQPDIIPTHHHALLGRPAPDFELADIDGNLWNLGKLHDGRPMVLIFYYGYHCPSCVRQLFDVNGDLPLFGEIGARVVAISADRPELTQRRFQENGPFGFPVLSDPGRKVARTYQMFKRHGTFVIDGNGMIRWVNVGDAPLRRNSVLLCQLAKLDGHLPSAGSTLR